MITTRQSFIVKILSARQKLNLLASLSATLVYVFLFSHLIVSPRADAQSVPGAQEIITSFNISQYNPYAGNPDCDKCIERANSIWGGCSGNSSQNAVLSCIYTILSEILVECHAGSNGEIENLLVSITSILDNTNVGVGVTPPVSGQVPVCAFQYIYDNIVNYPFAEFDIGPPPPWPLCTDCYGVPPRSACVPPHCEKEPSYISSMGCTTYPNGLLAGCLPIPVQEQNPIGCEIASGGSSCNVVPATDVVQKAFSCRACIFTPQNKPPEIRCEADQVVNLPPPTTTCTYNAGQDGYRHNTEDCQVREEKQCTGSCTGEVLRKDMHCAPDSTTRRQGTCDPSGGIS